MFLYSIGMVRNFKRLAKKLVQDHSVPEGTDPAKLIRIHVAQYRECARFGVHMITMRPKDKLSTIELEEHLFKYYKEKLMVQLL